MRKDIHPGEYGKYREESCKEVLRLLLGKENSVSDGFVITSHDHISTQCDIVVYNSSVSPFIADGIAKMFPAEEVRMIGEIKSTLSRQAYIDALRKMAENKKIIIEGRNSSGVCPHGRSDETYDTVVSFLICNKLDFNFDELSYDEVYSGIDRKYWHNSILSVEDATLSYLWKISDLPEEITEGLTANKINTSTVISWQYPIYAYKEKMLLATAQNYVHMQRDNKYEHIKRFFLDLAICSKEVWTYSYDPVEYLGMGIKSIYLDKD